MGDPFNLGDGRQLEDLVKAGNAEINLVVSAVGAAGSKSVKRKVWNPLCDRNPL